MLCTKWGDLSQKLPMCRVQDDPRFNATDEQKKAFQDLKRKMAGPQICSQRPRWARAVTSFLTWQRPSRPAEGTPTKGMTSRAP